MARILVVEDEADLQEVLLYNLRGAGHEAVEARGGQEALREARRRPPDLVLLDLMLPDLSGVEVCRRLKREEATRTVPIIILTARGEETDRVVGFELGADDYVVKPFSVRELLLRVQAVLRRGAPMQSGLDGTVEFGRLRLDAGAHRAWVEERELQLTPIEFRLLQVLLARRGRVRSRSDLLDEVWGITAEVTTRTVDAHVKRLREKLGRAGAYIETVRGVGYRFLSSPPADPP